MKIFIGADHRGFWLKKIIIDFLKKKGYDVVDVGVHQKETPCDYPLFSFRVAQSVLSEKKSRGILVCMSGIGHSIAANRVPGIRAALCYNTKAAFLSRAHNDANVFVIGSQFVTRKEIFLMLNTWLKTSFEGGRHLRRIRQIDRLVTKKVLKNH
jgi:RpiB/LacA/LacB family sugar-phosphate isomerase